MVAAYVDLTHAQEVTISYAAKEEKCARKLNFNVSTAVATDWRTWSANGS